MTNWEMYIVGALCFCFFTMWAIFIYESFGNIFGHKTPTKHEAQFKELRELEFKRESLMSKMEWLAADSSLINPETEVQFWKNREKFKEARDEVRKIFERIDELYKEIYNNDKEKED